MGLDLQLSRIDRDGPHAQFSYSGFNDFRERLAAVIGIELRAMAGFKPDGKPWPSPQEEPLVYLLDHSDCDGELDYDACAALVKRLPEVIDEALPSDDPVNSYYRTQARELVAMCAEVVEGDALRVEFR